ncbi:hypothetical protein DPMN_154127 [Dreissena polymorpha]|uniref:Uncharacterized protein n=1 Tax=Dreissena polymorpha TaxID=45954 RepID=A0A9D4J8U4_DREPO|nr:hypothetical protein DPMN_154127 [Dreissena polymorpha]
MGPARLFNPEEENRLADHIIHMGNIGYGYPLSVVLSVAAGYAKSLGKTIAKNQLSKPRFYSFLKRREELKVVTPQKLTSSRAKSSSKHTRAKYFSELQSVLQQNDLLYARERIFNINVTGFDTDHTPPMVVCGSECKPQAITSPRTRTVTIVGGANAIGNQIPPFYVFSGKRWVDQLL